MVIVTVKPEYTQTIGIIPEGWEVKPIRDIAPLQRGFDLPTKRLVKGKYPVVYSNGILNFHDSFQAKAPGVVTGRSGTIGKVTYVEDNYWPHNTSLWVTTFKGNHPKFIYYMYIFLQLERFATGSGVPTLNRNDVHSYRILLPKSYQEQATIAEFLSNADELIEQLDELIKKKKNFRQGVMQELLTGKTRLSGFSKEWKVKKFTEIFNKIPTKEFQIKTTEYRDFGSYPIIDQGKQKIIGYSNSTEKVFQCPKKGVVVFGDHTREIKFIDFNFVVGADGTQILTASNNDLPKFFYYQLKTKNIPNTGYNRHYKFLKEILLMQPEPEEQAAIAQVLSDMDAEIEDFEKKRDKYTMIKEGMVQQLLTGRIRLR